VLTRKKKAGTRISASQRVNRKTSDAVQRQTLKMKAFYVPTLSGKCAQASPRRKKAQRKMKKDACITGNPVKAGYINMICPGFLPKNVPLRRSGNTFFYRKCEACRKDYVLCKTDNSVFA
jgi:hypothetical protein